MPSSPLDPAQLRQALQDAVALFIADADLSPLAGGNGNVEFNVQLFVSRGMVDEVRGGTRCTRIVSGRGR